MTGFLSRIRALMKITWHSEKNKIDATIVSKLQLESKEQDQRMRQSEKLTLKIEEFH